ncbi:EscU/YscU/HrcU family type III secretion system export apparatus switch protein [Lentibacillus saliphilus]|uniref:EscU/YscU/HrcU family type III secretion system export apparatus switch protein n=1 Tax=Lentibacillus saliphilus TaxID=2737028 RepID=UPI001C2FDAC6|nr:EscU/YscU/HrcU family type III secretion system export apparatus switch protein [Lentibacillus saliphilus]
MTPNNRKKAIAMKYDDNQEYVPKITAKGTGRTAENILKKAAEHNIPIQEDASLAELLSELNINEKIPEELYQAVAEVFAFIYRIDEQRSETIQK